MYPWKWFSWHQNQVYVNFKPKIFRKFNLLQQEGALLCKSLFNHWTYECAVCSNDTNILILSRVLRQRPPSMRGLKKWLRVHIKHTNKHSLIFYLFECRVIDISTFGENFNKWTYSEKHPKVFLFLFINFYSCVCLKFRTVRCTLSRFKWTTEDEWRR